MSPSEYYERYYNWYKLTICKIANADDQANPIQMKEFAQAALDVDSAELKIWVAESEELKSKGIYSSRHHGVKDAEYSLGIDDTCIPCVGELEAKVNRYEKAMKEILDCCDLKNTFILSSDDTAFAGDVKDIAQASLDGEPTTADEHNKKDVKIDLKDKSREKKINMIQSIGYRGEE